MSKNIHDDPPNEVDPTFQSRRFLWHAAEGCGLNQLCVMTILLEHARDNVTTDHMLCLMNM